MDPLNIPDKLEFRSFARSWDNRGYWKNLGRPWIRRRSLFSQIFKRLLLGWTLWIYLPNLNFVTLRVRQITGGTVKIWEVSEYAHAPFSPKFLTAFCSHGPCDLSLPNLKFVALRIPEIIGGTEKIWAVLGYAHAPFSPKLLMAFVSHGRCEYTCRILSL